MRFGLWMGRKMRKSLPHALVSYTKHSSRGVLVALIPPLFETDLPIVVRVDAIEEAYQLSLIY